MLSTAQSLTELCGVLNNWFDRQRRFGTFTIVDGLVTGLEGLLLPGQYYRVIGSVFHDGVHQYPVPDSGESTEAGAENTPASVLPNETFQGAVWAMVVPDDVLRLADNIAAWREQYEAASLSPFTQETVPGLYSYIKGASNGSGGTSATWQSAFSESISRWRKL